MVLSKMIEELCGDSIALDTHCISLWRSTIEASVRQHRRITPHRGGSHFGRAKNLPRRFREAEQRLMRQYFDENSTYPASHFRRRFRMRRALFLRIFRRVQEEDGYFTTKADAVGRIGVAGIVKMVAAMKMLAYGCSADAIDDSLEMAESTILESLGKFCSAVVSVGLCVCMFYILMYRISGVWIRVSS
jgi:hypothetical protein